MDLENPAIAEQFLVPPALIEEVGDNPAVIERIARKMLLVHMHVTHEKMRDFDKVSLNQQQNFMEFLAKAAGIGNKAAQQGPAGPGFSINIVFDQKTAKTVIDLPKVDIVEAAVIEAPTTTAADPTP